ncbi:MAG: cytochrome c family protein [Rickettsiaceae bacterium]|nr:MAG: cytochrome c family protein [Rickettsiaceae bacterium]
MSGFELNKLAASILLASLIAMIVGFITNILYKPDISPKNRGYQVELTNNPPNLVVAEEPQLDIEELMKKANAEAGKNIIKKCISCHSFEKGGANKVGPHLWDVAGRDKAKVEDYKYSAALTNIGGKWDDKSLFHFLYKPSKFAPGTKMTFAGLSKPEEIADVILFLKQLTHNN